MISNALFPKMYFRVRSITGVIKPRFIWFISALMLIISVIILNSKQEIVKPDIVVAGPPVAPIYGVLLTEWDRFQEIVPEVEDQFNPDPWTETNKLTLSEGIAIGRSLAVDNNVLVIGALDAAYIVEREGDNWTENLKISKLSASNWTGKSFGTSVSISGDTVVVGATVDYSNLTQAGSAYIFEKPKTGWTDMTETAKLTAGDTGGRYLGNSVSINGGTVVVGAYLSSGNGYQSGAAYVFVRPPDGWQDMTHTAKLTQNRRGSWIRFGQSIAMNGDTIVIGANRDSFRGLYAGAAYIFEKPAQGWIDMTETAELIPSNIGAGDSFGISVDISGTTVIVGSRSDNNRGSAYIFERFTDEWVTSAEVARLSASDADKFDHFGSSVAIRGKMAIVGARDDDTTYEDTGSAYIFMRQDHNWTSMLETTKLVASDRKENAIFGDTVTISGSTIIVGATWDRGSRGAAYFFEIEQDTE